MVHLAVNTVQKQAHIVKTVKIVLNLMAAKAVITAQAQGGDVYSGGGGGGAGFGRGGDGGDGDYGSKAGKDGGIGAGGAAADKAHAAALAAMVLLLSNGEVRI